jgi:RNA polymerase sigma-70 factor (family 1)
MAKYRDLTDLELVAHLKKGDHVAYTEIFERYSSLLYSHAYKKLRNREEAQDIVQEVFTVLWTRREDIAIGNNVIGYLYTAVRNKIYNLIYHKQVESEYIVSLKEYINVEYAMTDYVIREKQLQEIIDKEVAELPPRIRQAFELSRNKYLSHKEIAEELDISPDTVTEYIKKALKILKPKIGLALFIIHNLQL